MFDQRKSIRDRKKKEEEKNERRELEDLFQPAREIPYILLLPPSYLAVIFIATIIKKKISINIRDISLSSLARSILRLHSRRIPAWIPFAYLRSGRSVLLAHVQRTPNCFDLCSFRPSSIISDIVRSLLSWALHQEVAQRLLSRISQQDPLLYGTYQCIW